jgi:hypothetical protein
LRDVLHLKHYSYRTELVFFYRHVLLQDTDGHIDAVRARQFRYLPTVLTYEKAIAPLSTFILNQGLKLCFGKLHQPAMPDFNQRNLEQKPP